jgi:hypothetical protein
MSVIAVINGQARKNEEKIVNPPRSCCPFVEKLL